MVEVGETLTEPESATAPTPEIVTEVALFVDHASVEAPPAVIEVGVAVKDEMVGTAGGEPAVNAAITAIYIPVFG